MKKKNELDNAYYEAGRDWFFDRYEAAQVLANRWFVAFLAMSFLVGILTVSLMVLMPLKTLVPLVIHQNTTTGEVWVDRPETHYAPSTDAQTQSDIVRYITTRESYTAADINQRFHGVLLLSAKDIQKQYIDEQANSNSSAPVNVLGREGIRTVTIQDIVFIDKAGTQELRHFRQPAQNLAKVDFVTTTTDPSGNKKQIAWVATIGWVYKGLPSNKEAAWDNWNGFTVTTYRVDPKNVGS